MKRIAIFLIVLSMFFPFSSSATVVATGSVSLGNTGMSLVDGTAFVMLNVLGTGLNLAPYAAPGGHKITICSVTYPTQCAVGYIKNANTTESLSGTELITNGTFETCTGTADDGVSDNFGTWSETAGAGLVELTATVHGGSNACKLTGAAAGTDRGKIESGAMTVVANRLNKITFWTRGDATNAGRTLVYNLTLGATILGQASTGITGTTYTAINRYLTVPPGTTSISTVLYAPNVLGGISYFDDVSFQQVITPSATGVTITSTKGGEVYNWASNNFTTGLNDAAGYSYIVENLGASITLGTGPAFTLGVGTGIQGP